jgi:small subunit ribosomal protein S4
MARYTGPVCRLCRREGEKLYLKAERCHTSKCAIENRQFPPGERNYYHRRQSEYGRQLREKQKVKRMYGVLERQFRNVFEEAENERDITGEALLRRLELRLDNVMFRMGLAGSRRQARQYINHGHVKVNGERVDVPSFQVDEGDEIEMLDRMKENEQVEQSMSLARQRGVKDWLNLQDDASGSVERPPERSDIDDVDIQESLIVELYSK